MTDHTAAHSTADPLDALAEEFLDRLRRGESPAVSEYADRHPALAGRIRGLFPTLAALEGLGAASGDAPPLPPGVPARLGDFRILGEVGRGGMGVVYEAVQESLGRRVALKVLPAAVSGRPTFAERFRREARAAAKLHHTNIVPVFGVGEDGGSLFYAMQYIHGQSVDAVLAEVRRLRSGDTAPVPLAETASLNRSVAQGLLTGDFVLGPAPAAAPPSSGVSSLTAPTGDRYPREVARLATQAADALQYAHEHGVLHRDVKPSNFLLDAEGSLWVADFGLAKDDDAGDLTESGAIIGTLRYMAPERFRGDGDARADVYALGATLYEMLTLRPAYGDADRLALIDHISRGDAIPPRRLDPGIPRDLETVVLKAMARPAVERYRTAGELAADLRLFLADRPVKARRTSPLGHAVRWCRRNPVVAGLAAAVAGLLVAVAVVSATAAVRLRGALAQAEAAEDAARHSLWDALAAQAHGSRVVSRREGQRFDALKAIRDAVTLGRELGLPPEKFAHLRDEAIAAMTLADLAVVERKLVLPPGATNLALAPGLTHYARTDPDGTVSVRVFDTDAEVCRLPKAETPARTRLGPGAGYAVRIEAEAGRATVWRLGPTPARVGVVAGPGHLFGDAMSPDGRRWVANRSTGHLDVVDVATGRLAVRHPPAGVAYNSAEFHPTRPVVARGRYSVRTVDVCDIETGRRLTWTPPDPRCAPHFATWHPDGRRLLTMPSDDGPAYLVPFDADAWAFGEPHAIGGPDFGHACVAAFLPAGDRFAAYDTWGHAPRLCDPGPGRTLLRTPGVAAVAGSLTPSADGRRVSGAVGPDGRVDVWTVAGGYEYRTLDRPGPAGEVHTGQSPPAVSPCGRLAAVPCGHGVAVYDLAAGRDVGFLPIGHAGDAVFSSVAFDGTGALVVNSFHGCHRWPQRATPAGRAFGPPDHLPFRPGNRAVVASADGRLVAQVQYAGYGMAEAAGAWLWRADRPATARWFAPLRAGFDAAFSPDGRWAAFVLGGDGRNATRVVEVATGRTVWTSPGGGQLQCRFTPDGRWLIGIDGGPRLFAVGTWEPGPRLGPAELTDVSADGRLALMRTPRGAYELRRLPAGDLVATLEDPGRVADNAAFTPDGTKVVAFADHGVHVWDLRRIRAGLAALGLDWADPPYPPEPAGVEPEPLAVTFAGEPLMDRATADRFTAVRESAELAWLPTAAGFARRGRALHRLGQTAAAWADYDAALAADPSRADLRGFRGELRLAAGDAAGAAADFTAAVADDPDDAALRGKRALALVRAGKAAEALADLDTLIAGDATNAAALRLRARARRQAGDAAGAAADAAAALKLTRNNPADANNAAWYLVVEPCDGEDAWAAVELARRAIAGAVSDRDRTLYRNTLGVALYRAGQWADAQDEFEASLAAGDGSSDAYDLYFLALCRHRQNDAAGAKAYFDRATRWHDERRGKLTATEAAELAAFRAEAVAAVGGR